MAVEGLDKLRARFRAVPQAVRDAARKAMEKNAIEMVEMMQRLAPKKTGALRISIGWTWGKAPKGSMTIGKLAESANSEFAITIYAGTRDKSLGAMDAFYAAFQEFGTKHMAANPYFWPSVRANKERGRSRYNRAVKVAAEKAFNG